MSNHPPIHDGQADSVPCQCPACTSPFIARRLDRPAPPAAGGEVIDLTARREAVLAKARAE